MRKGFNTIEVFIVVLFFGIVLSVLYMTTAHFLHFKEIDYDAIRINDVMAISNALSVSKVDNMGRYIDYIESLSPGVALMIGQSQLPLNIDCVAPVFGNIELDYLVESGYLPMVPINPSENNNWNNEYTGYYLLKNDDHTLTVGACEYDGQERIEVTR